ncbi:TlpA family protein disulfide reductase [Actinophytocola algeriensis]|uniref:Thiol-disulfide isomerase/thioredoxin n=1 Tax=Actinophytocola algeriensis TaxID=1768010 RepID=A0A7W7Q3Y6_9PSEU|nr:thioredoxin family protein [Actinophytocola algeriensis]MBB4906457.1 thiol-disulfide isomerase/thioredoxin [Actinophytocola algeriensis]MBE1477938.1 thiol-disulfide isomerase/thioredoxin [Actinophytocola algeriensis]
MTGVLVLVGTLVLATVAGLVMRSRNGRVRTTAATVATVATSDLPADITSVLAPGGVTLVQLSTTFCAPCRHTRVLLSDLASRTDGLHHTELDLTERPELAKELAVLRTPTTLAVDRSGTEILRVGGVPRRDELLAALQPHLT